MPQGVSVLVQTAVLECSNALMSKVVRAAMGQLVASNVAGPKRVLELRYSAPIPVPAPSPSQEGEYLDMVLTDLKIQQFTSSESWESPEPKVRLG